MRVALTLASALAAGCSAPGPEPAVVGAASQQQQPAGSASPGKGAPSDGPAMGAYGTDGGHLVVTSVAADSFSFRLTFVAPTPGAHHADLEGGVARRQGPGDYSYVGGDDCVLRFVQTQPDVLQVTQKGTCEGAGFGAFVSVDGRYSRK